jgi:hypothetical protein
MADQLDSCGVHYIHPNDCSSFIFLPFLRGFSCFSITPQPTVQPEEPEVPGVPEVPLVPAGTTPSPPHSAVPPTLAEALNTEVELIMKHNVSHHRMNMRSMVFLLYFINLRQLNSVGSFLTVVKTWFPRIGSKIFRELTDFFFFFRTLSSVEVEAIVPGRKVYKLNGTRSLKI